MNEQLIQLITEYGLETVILAILINVITGLIKLPVKALAKKMTDGTRLTRYIVFFPILIGFLLALLYAKLVQGSIEINHSFVSLWVSSSTLSLTFYAIWEKLFPSKEKILKDYEIEANKNLLNEIKVIADSMIIEDKDTESSATIEETTDLNPSEQVKTKIILRGNNYAKVETEKESE